MPTDVVREGQTHGKHVRLLGYCAALAFNAGLVNAVALMILAVPVGNLTGVTTQLGMDTAHPWMYQSHVLIAILVGFLIGATVSGRLIASTGTATGTRHAVVLTIQAILLLLAAVGVEGAVEAQIAGLGIEQTAVQALLAAAALGLQNGLTSSFRGMAVRTTHFTGTITDLGLMIGRSRKHGFDKWKAAILTVTLVLFLTGGIAGILAGAQFGGYALLIPAAVCMFLGSAYLLHHRHGRRDLTVVVQASAATA
ncbi:hypothetical protein A5634_24350 [Mycobacterium asiaticum]|uniref:DUF1275 family protein n=1 Tax=Mycobacterium asiaticum TaxID=1790 RepID=A0A1A3P2X7_MYCAS|nr:YoaK family protein [Mycobacterium asiaticum]OBK26937.1 hypothetical protein A5634_24350 [Mycobacterium asiaticum]